MKKDYPSAAADWAYVEAFCLTACRNPKTKNLKQQWKNSGVNGPWKVKPKTSAFLGRDNITNTTGGPGDIMDFRNDGKVYSDVSGTKDTSTYSLSGDTKIVLGGTETFDIKTLSSNSFTIYNKEFWGR